jgi:hypothetical protein
VWGEGQVENRERGGTRPGLVKFDDYRFHTGSGTISALHSARILDADGNHQYDLYVIADGVFYNLRGGVASTLVAVLLDDNGVEIWTEDGQTIDFESLVSDPVPGGEAFRVEEL